MEFGVWLGVRNNSAECFGWDKEAINNVIGVLWRIVADGKWTVDRPGDTN